MPTQSKGEGRQQRQQPKQEEEEREKTVVEAAADDERGRFRRATLVHRSACPMLFCCHSAMPILFCRRPCHCKRAARLHRRFCGQLRDADNLIPSAVCSCPLCLIALTFCLLNLTSPDFLSCLLFSHQGPALSRAAAPCPLLSEAAYSSPDKKKHAKRSSVVVTAQPCCGSLPMALGCHCASTAKLPHHSRLQ